jgi:ubiquinone/menaquinone biosynthesis C-methylase UbiE
MTMPDSTSRFGNRADAYDRYRPHYAPEIIRFLERETGFSKGMAVADVGAGTGISAEHFLANGNTVYCIEPNDAMRKKAEERFAVMPGFRSVNGRSDATGLPDACVDVILAAQAFHWFDRQSTRREFLRIGRPAAWTVIMWMDRRVTTPFESAYELLLREHGIDYASVNHKNITDAEMLEWYSPGTGKRHLIQMSQELGFDDLKGRLLSVSYVPGPGEQGFDEMMIALRRCFDAHQRNGKVRLGYDLRMFYGRLNT